MGKVCNMNVSDTLVARLKKLLRVRFKVNTGTVTADTELGKSPIGFEDIFIQSDFRIRLSDWFDDLIDPFPAVEWDGTTALSDVVKDIMESSTIKDIKKTTVYRSHVLDLATAAFDSAAGHGAQSVPASSRPEVQQEMNDDLTTSLLTNISLADLAGDRDTILSNVGDRMVI